MQHDKSPRGPRTQVGRPLTESIPDDAVNKVQMQTFNQTTDVAVGWSKTSLKIYTCEEIYRTASPPLACAQGYLILLQMSTVSRRNHIAPSLLEIMYQACKTPGIHPRMERQTLIQKSASKPLLKKTARGGRIKAKK